MDVVEIVRQKQAELGVDQLRMSRLLGISPSYLCLLYSGQREPGAKVMLGLLLRWPELLQGGDGEHDAQVDEAAGGGDGDPGDPVVLRAAGPAAPAGAIE